MARFSFKTPKILKEWRLFFAFLHRYFRMRGYVWFAKFEGIKDVLVDLLYKRRGKYARPFLHFGTIGLTFLIVTFGPFIIAQAEDDQREQENRALIAASDTAGTGFNTVQSLEVQQYRGGEIIPHQVQEGETLSSIAQRYNLSVSTIEWENNLPKNARLKPGQELRILPVDGIRHKVVRGETIYTIGKKYGLEDESEVQRVIDYPFNEFLNDETFELATGQYLLVPEGVKPDDPVVRPAVRPIATTPNAGSVTATGSFVWPAAGKITQGYRFYHKAYDIANRAGGPILAADAGTVTVAGWIDNSGYANRVMVDHGNGLVTLYAHLSVIQVQPGQTVKRGDVVGQMGCTGRCTGTHLHFEVRQGGVLLDPGQFLR
jgi:murein DD-endopeptidase MepM/ murein hydrolase activator NlpD